MNLPKKIKTIEVFKESILKEKKSTFIAQVYSVLNSDQAEEYLSKVKKKFYDASHHCYAFKLADGSSCYSDAGEPNGTAGVRIINAIEHFGLTNQLVIVIRYFGGIKLGVGPLGKAYYSAAFKVLNESDVITKNLFQKIFITSDISLNSHVQRILSSHHSTILNSEFLSEASYECLSIVAEMKVIFQKLAEISQNKIKVTTSKEFLYR
jgi:uncharacterized YigZ family protein